MDEGKPLGVGPVVVIANALRDLEGDEAGGVMRTSGARPTLNRRTNPCVRCMSFRPEGNSCSDLGSSAWLQRPCCEDPPHLLLRELLAADATWQDLAEEGGALEAGLSPVNHFANLESFAHLWVIHRADGVAIRSPGQTMY